VQPLRLGAFLAEPKGPAVGIVARGMDDADVARLMRLTLVCWRAWRPRPYVSAQRRTLGARDSGR